MTRVLLIGVVALFLTGVLVGQTPNSAQSPESTMVLTGTLYDENGSVIVTGRVVARGRNAKDRKYESTTSSEGGYRMVLPLDVYVVEATAPGFCHARVDRFKVVNSTFGKMSLDLVLEVPSLQQRCRQESTIDEPGKEPARGKGGSERNKSRT